MVKHSAAVRQILTYAWEAPDGRVLYLSHIDVWFLVLRGACDQSLRPSKQWEAHLRNRRGYRVGRRRAGNLVAIYSLMTKASPISLNCTDKAREPGLQTQDSVRQQNGVLSFTVFYVLNSACWGLLQDVQNRLL